LKGNGSVVIVNHLENLDPLCSKTGMVKSLRRYYNQHMGSIETGYSVSDSTPTTYLILASCNTSEFFEFTKRFKELKEHEFDYETMPAKQCMENMWLIKPANNNQGRGIEVFKNNYEDMKKFLLSKNPRSYWVVQKYIERPLLYYGRKFDIRMWALMTWKQEFYIYRIGYIRTSSDSYKTDARQNYVHLTNNCLQQYGANYGAHEAGNTISFNRFCEYLALQFPSYKFDFERDFLARMKDLMIDTYLAAKNELNPNKRTNCFELLGYDFMIDEDFRVWLIEANTNPYIGIPNKYIEGLLPKMLNDLFEIVLDPYLPLVNKPAPKEIPNQFELLYGKRVNLRRSFNAPLYPIAELNPNVKDGVETKKLLKLQQKQRLL